MTGKPQTCTHARCSARTVARRLCRAHYQAAWKANELGQHVKLPTRVRARTICAPGHKHDGSTTCYIQHQCRCEPCRDGNTAREQRRKKLKAYGRFDTGLVDATPAREHLLVLGEFGMGYKRVAKLAGLGITPVRNLIWGRQEPGPRYGEIPKRTKRETAYAILEVRPELANLADGARVPSGGAVRRAQALVSRGWSQSKIAARIGVTDTNFSIFLRGDRVLVSTYRAISDLYDELWNTEPPAETWRDRAARTRAIAHAKGQCWAPPMAWDDIDTDDAPDLCEAESDVLIDDQAVELAISGLRVRLTSAERRAAVSRLHSRRLGDRYIAETIGCAERTVTRIREELTLPGWTVAEQQAGTHDPRRAAKAAA